MYLLKECGSFTSSFNIITFTLIIIILILYELVNDESLASNWKNTYYCIRCKRFKEKNTYTPQFEKNAIF